MIDTRPDGTGPIINAAMARVLHADACRNDLLLVLDSACPMRAAECETAGRRNASGYRDYASDLEARLRLLLIEAAALPASPW